MPFWQSSSFEPIHIHHYHHLKLYRDKNSLLDKEIDICLAIDACSFSHLANKNKKYAFVFYIQPMNSSLKCVPINFLPYTNGKANENIICIRDQICLVLNRNKFRVVAVATDGDNSYDKKANDIFEINLKSLTEDSKNPLASALQAIRNCIGIYWISDCSIF